MNDSGIFFKGIFLFSGLITLPWGLFTDSISRVIGGLGLLTLCLLTRGSQ
jgi:hypothetical protein